jgi:hypothetical protein
MAENIDLGWKWQLLDVRGIILMTLDMLEAKLCKNRMCCRHRREYIGVVSEAPPRHQISKLRYISNCTGAIHKQLKLTLDVEIKKRRQFIQIQCNRSKSCSFAPKRALTFIPPIDGARVQNQLFFAGRIYDPREGTTMVALSAICSNEESAI